MRVAYLNNHYQLGGAETVVRQLHVGIKKHGWDSRLLITEGKDLTHNQDVLPLYPRVLSKLDHSRFAGLIPQIATRTRWTDRAVRRLVKSPYDLIHVHNFHGLYAKIETFAELVNSKPVVWTFHRFWGVTGGCDHPFGCRRFQTGCGHCPQVGNFAVGPIDHTAREWELKLQLLRDLPLVVVSPSRHLADVVQSSPIGERWQTVVIPNGIDPSQFRADRKHNPTFRCQLGLDPEKLCLLFTNRNYRDPIKGWPVIREALSTLSPDGLQLVLVGEGSAWAASELPSSWDIVDCGYIDDRTRIASLYEAADIFLYASEGENFPCAILEAMSSACCVVSTPVDGVREQVQSGYSGYLADGMDGLSLARCLRTALQHPSHFLELGMRARRRVASEFSEDAMITSHLQLYERILKSAPGRWR